MGKPFTEELKLNYDLLNWVSELDLDVLKKSIESCRNTTVYIIGSGGSLSACYLFEFYLSKSVS
jgi:fructoselysine-6-P-deglycase FrlB-like protein